MDSDSLAFYTKFNYLKRYVTGSATHTGTFATNTVTHSLGYVPAVKVYFEVGGKLFHAHGNVSSRTDSEGVTLFPRHTSTSLVYTMNAGVSKTVIVYWIIYLDDLQ